MLLNGIFLFFYNSAERRGILVVDIFLGGTKILYVN
jgi:hypothetical protein